MISSGKSSSSMGSLTKKVVLVPKIIQSISCNSLMNKIPSSLSSSSSYEYKVLPLIKVFSAAS